LLELEIERDENKKALQYLKQLREKEKQELSKVIEVTKKESL
jgi:hypothetical protein